MERCGKIGDGALPSSAALQGDVARRNGDGILRNFGLVAGDSARASSWLLLGILIGGAVIFFPRSTRRSDEIDECFGLDDGTERGLERGETGTSVSELVAVLSVWQLLGELISVSDEQPPSARLPGTVNVLFSAYMVIDSESSVDDSPHGNVFNVIFVGELVSEMLLLVVTVIEPVPVLSSSEHKDSDPESEPSSRNSEVSDKVSQDAIGASFGLGGISKLVI